MPDKREKTEYDLGMWGIELSISEEDYHHYFPKAVELGIINPGRIFYYPHADPNKIIPDSIVPWLERKKE